MCVYTLKWRNYENKNKNKTIQRISEDLSMRQ